MSIILLDKNSIKFLKEDLKDLKDKLNPLNPYSSKDVDPTSMVSDKSGGAGIVPEEWSEPIAWYNGYAGGLGPQNLEEQLSLIAKANSNQLISPSFE